MNENVLFLINILFAIRIWAIILSTVAKIEGTRNCEIYMFS